MSPSNQGGQTHTGILDTLAPTRGTARRDPASLAYDDVPPRLQAGPYEAKCIEATNYFDRGFKAWKCRLLFEVIPDRQLICAYFHLGQDRQPHAGRRSRFWAAWVTANGSPPRQGQRMEPSIFINKFFEVDVADVTRRHDGLDQPETAIYSKVKHILREIRDPES